MEMGFDHIAIATGAGKPTIVKMKNNLIRGIRKASDFLMALQLTGAAKKDSIANLHASASRSCYWRRADCNRYSNRSFCILSYSGRKIS